MSPDRKFNVTVLALFCGTFVFGLFRFDGPAKGYWDTYITAPAMFMNTVPVQFVLKDDSPAFDPQLEGKLPWDLVGPNVPRWEHVRAQRARQARGEPAPEVIEKENFGIITKDQRLGPGITASFEYAMFGQLGFRVLYALAFALIFPLTVLVFREVYPEHRWLGIFGALSMTWTSYMFIVDRLNANLFVFPLSLLVIYLLLRRDRLILLGLTFGVLAGIRNEAICFVPAISMWMLLPLQSSMVRPDAGSPGLGRRFGQLVLVGTLTVVAMLPIFYWKWFALGDPLMHPSQFSHFQGFRPEFEHSFFGKPFKFNGLFNWPFHTDLVRTPHFGYPTYLLFPLATIKSLGLVIFALILFGTWALFRERRRVFALFILWMAPVYALFGPQENWEEVKMTFMLLAWPPLGVMASAGLVPLARDPATRRRHLVTVGALAALTFGCVQGLGAVHVPQDERWYVRFPNADKTLNPAAQAGLAETERNDWVYFQSYETDEEIARERRKLTRVYPWPGQYLPLNWDFRREWEEMMDEAGREDLVVLEIWGYIYGTRR